MKTLFAFIAMSGIAVAPVLADDGKKHEFDPTNLPKPVKVKAGDVILVKYPIGPADVEEVKGESDNKDVTVRAQPGNGQIRIAIRCNAKGNAEVGWWISKVDGGIFALKGLKIVAD